MVDIDVATGRAKDQVNINIGILLLLSQKTALSIFIEKKKEFESLANKLNEEDNHVFMIVRLKE